MTSAYSLNMRKKFFLSQWTKTQALLTHVTKGVAPKLVREEGSEKMLVTKSSSHPGQPGLLACQST